MLKSFGVGADGYQIPGLLEIRSAGRVYWSGSNSEVVGMISHLVCENMILDGYGHGTLVM